MDSNVDVEVMAMDNARSALNKEHHQLHQTKAEQSSNQGQEAGQLLVRLDPSCRGKDDDINMRNMI
jgi:hypothetical protein